MYWRDWRALERAVKRFRSTKARGRLAERAQDISLLCLDEVAFEDIMQELCQVRTIQTKSYLISHEIRQFSCCDVNL